MEHDLTRASPDILFICFCFKGNVISNKRNKAPSCLDKLMKLILDTLN